MRRTLAALRYQVNAQGQGASACFEHLHEGTQQWTRYSPEQSCLIATALAGNPDAVIQLPGLPFAVKMRRERHVPRHAGRAGLGPAPGEQQ